MANVKSRSNARSANGRAESKTVNKSVEPIAVMKNASILDTSHDVEQFLARNGNKVTKSNLPNDDKAKIKIFPLHQTSLMSKSGRIKRKDPEKLKLLDNILKSELLINDTVKAKPKKKRKVNNNNDIEISNHNNDIEISNHNNGIEISNHNKSEDKIIKPPKVVEKEKQESKTNAKKSPKKPSKPDTGIFVSNPFQNLDFSRSISPSPASPLFECDYCGKTYKYKHFIEKHIYGHLNLKPHQCPQCPKKFHYFGNMQVHVMKIHNEFDDLLDHYECHICDKAFLMKETLNAHLSTHHSKKASFFKCLYCEKKFLDILQLTEHETKHLVNGRYKCTMCEMDYGVRNNLEAHFKSHMKIKDYICQHCGKEFLRLNSMHRHVQVCHAGHRIQCPICKKKLKGHLTEHLRTHDKKRPHKCPDCKQSFTQSTQLTVHRRSHTGARPYPCKICDRSFSHSTALMLHIRRHTGEKPFPCAMCPLMFSQLPHMKAHMRKIHGKENAYKCNKCAQFFKLKVGLESHKKTCTVGDKDLSFEEKIQASVQYEEIEVESIMTLSRMRYLLAVLLTIIASKEKLKYLGFNKRLIDDLLVESLEAMRLTPCNDDSLSPHKRLKANIEILLAGTVPKDQMEALKKKNKTTEELLEMLTEDNKKEG